MSIDPKLLEILACPLCKAPVKLTPDKKGLKCVKCHRVYPVRDDIPIMLIDEATIEKAPRRKAKPAVKPKAKRAAKPKAKPKARA